MDERCVSLIKGLKKKKKVGKRETETERGEGRKLAQTPHSYINEETFFEENKHHLQAFVNIWRKKLLLERKHAEL